MAYQANEERYGGMIYRRCGASGLKLPVLSLGTWHNFGEQTTRENAKAMLFTAFDHGITHIDCANNYGPPAGAAEEFLGDVLSKDLRAYRDELIVTTKAGYYMWPGPYGEWGSKKNLLASLDQSLKRLKLDYVDIFYHHRPDPDTPLEESMEAPPRKTNCMPMVAMMGLTCILVMIKALMQPPATPTRMTISIVRYWFTPAS